MNNSCYSWMRLKTFFSIRQFHLKKVFFSYHKLKRLGDGTYKMEVHMTLYDGAIKTSLQKKSPV